MAFCPCINSLDSQHYGTPIGQQIPQISPVKQLKTLGWELNKSEIATSSTTPLEPVESCQPQHVAPRTVWGHPVLVVTCLHPYNWCFFLPEIRFEFLLEEVGLAHLSICCCRWGCMYCQLGHVLGGSRVRMHWFTIICFVSVGVE